MTSDQAFTAPLPKPVRKIADLLRRATGCEPDVTYPAPGRTRLTVASARVEVTVTFKGKNGSWLGSTLKVDGEIRPNAENERDLARIWNDPDGTGSLPAGELPPIPADGDVATAPRDVQWFYRRLRDQMGEVVRAGYDASRRLWVIGADFPGRGMRFFFARVPARGWRLDDHGPFGGFQIVRDGVNVTAEAAGKADKAIAMMTAGFQSTDTAGEGKAAGAALAARSNAVETRRGAVIRELPAGAARKLGGVDSHVTPGGSALGWLGALMLTASRGRL